MAPLHSHSLEIFIPCNSHCFLISDSKGWASGEDDHHVAEAQYDFSGENEDELSFKAGQKINLAPKGRYYKCCKNIPDLLKKSIFHCYAHVY